MMVGKAWEGKPLRGEGLQPVAGESQEDPNAWPTRQLALHSLFLHPPQG